MMATCQDLGVPIHWHAGAGIALRVPRWKGFTPNQGLYNLARGAD